jgi:hypothetical protein
MSFSKVLFAFRTSTLLCTFNNLRSVPAVKPFFRVEEWNCSLLGVFFPPSLGHSGENFFVGTLYLFEVKNQTMPFVSEKA